MEPEFLGIFGVISAQTQQKMIIGYLFLTVLYSFIKQGWDKNSWYMKYMPVIFLFSAAHDLLSNMCSFD